MMKAFVKSSLSLSPSLFHTHILFPLSLSRLSFSVSAWGGGSGMQGGERISQGSRAHLKWGNGKTCPSNVSSRAVSGLHSEPCLIWHHNVTFHLHLQQMKCSTLCFVHMSLYTCVCVTERRRLTQRSTSRLLLMCQNADCWLDIAVSCGDWVPTSHLQLWLLDRDIG